MIARDPHTIPRRKRDHFWSLTERLPAISTSQDQLQWMDAVLERSIAIHTDTVQATIKIVLRDFEVPIECASSHLILPSDQRCDARRDECLDLENGQTFWPIVSQDSCQFDRYDVLYEDTATKLTPKSNHTMLTVFMITTQDTTFALAKTAEFNLCGYIMTQTEHPKFWNSGTLSFWRHNGDEHSRQDRKSPSIISICICQFKVCVRRKTYQNSTDQALHQHNGTEMCASKTNTSERPIAL